MSEEICNTMRLLTDEQEHKAFHPMQFATASEERFCGNIPDGLEAAGVQSLLAMRQAAYPLQAWAWGSGHEQMACPGQMKPGM